jgi:hypothetical protein
MSNISFQTRRDTSNRAVAGVLLASVALFALTATSASAHQSHHGVEGVHVGVSKPVGGTTVVNLDPAVVTALTSLGVAVAPVAPATSPLAGQLSFPVSGGRINYSKVRHGRVTKRNLNGWVTHTGGMTFTKAAVAPATTPTVLTLSNLVVNLSAGKEGKISASVDAKPFMVNLLKLDTAVVDPLDKSISANVTLADQGARVLNRKFKTTAFVAGMKIGTVKVTPTF